MKPLVLVACLSCWTAAFATPSESRSGIHESLAGSIHSSNPTSSDSDASGIVATTADISIAGDDASYAACEITLAPPDQTIGIGGGYLWIDVIAPRPDCSWTVTVTAAWAVLKSPVDGTGSATLAFEIERNAGPGRAAYIRVGSAEFLLTQIGVGGIRHVHGDFSGDGAADLALFRPSTGEWWIPRLFVTTLGGVFQLPVPGDYDGDAITDPATFEPTSGIWRFADGSTVTWGLPGDLPVPADYDGDGRTDVAVFRPGTGRWYILNGDIFDWGLPADVPVAADFDGDGRADPAVFRRSTGTWWIRGIGAWTWGRGGDIPVAADYDGDGRADIAVFRPGTGEWFVRDQFTIVYGRGGDLPVPLDYDGDGRAELAVYRRAGNLWFINGYGAGMPWGQPGDLPAAVAAKEWLISADDADGLAGRDQAFLDIEWYSIRLFRWHWRFSSLMSATPRSLVGDYIHGGSYYDTPRAADFDGDGRVDLVLFTWNWSLGAIGSWSVKLSHTGYTRGYEYDYWGVATDTVVPADYDGDRKADLMVFRPSEGRWYLKTSTSGFTESFVFDWGLSGDIAVPADYDGDGRSDLAVFRPSNGRWYVRRSSDGSMWTVDWGLATDTPAPADFDGDGLVDVAIFRPSTGEWWVRYSATGFTTYSTTVFGGSSDVPLPGDHNGDGLASPAYYGDHTGFVASDLTYSVGVGSLRLVRQR